MCEPEDLKNWMPLGAKALLLYQLEKLQNESPLPIQRKRTRPNVTNGAAESPKRITNKHHEEAAPAARKVS